MKKVRMMMMLVMTVITTSIFAQSKTETFKVNGNCGMCKSRIEKAAKTEGVTKADWDVDSKIMTVSFDTGKTSIDEIQKKIAAVGHDTEKFAAEADAYEKLPGCCRYDRNNKQLNERN